MTAPPAGSPCRARLRRRTPPGIRYFFRAVPFGNLPPDHQAPLVPWPTLHPFIPPEHRTLPPLGLVFGVDSLIEPESIDPESIDPELSPWKLPAHFVDERGNLGMAGGHMGRA